MTAERGILPEQSVIMWQQHAMKWAFLVCWRKGLERSAEELGQRVNQKPNRCNEEVRWVLPARFQLVTRRAAAPFWSSDTLNAPLLGLQSKPAAENHRRRTKTASLYPLLLFLLQGESSSFITANGHQSPFKRLRVSSSTCFSVSDLNVYLLARANKEAALRLWENQRTWSGRDPCHLNDKLIFMTSHFLLPLIRLFCVFQRRLWLHQLVVRIHFCPFLGSIFFFNKY